MNFQTMNKQRKFILIFAVVGIIAMFLPWIDVFFISINGMHGKGILVFLCFIACGIMAILGDQTKPLDRAKWMITLILSGLTSLGMIISLFGGMSTIGGFAFGFYLALIAILGIAFAAFAFRAAGYTIKDGFNNLKQDITEKTRSVNPPPPPPRDL